MKALITQELYIHILCLTSYFKPIRSHTHFVVGQPAILLGPKKICVLFRPKDGKVPSLFV